MTILDVAGVGLGSQQLITADNANRVPAHSQEHDPDGYVSLIDLRKPGNVNFVSESVFLHREGWEDDPCPVVAPKHRRSGLRFRNRAKYLTYPAELDLANGSEFK